MRRTAELAREHGVRLHTHLAETRDEDRYCAETYGCRPTEYLRRMEWLGTRRLARPLRPSRRRRDSTVRADGDERRPLPGVELPARLRGRAGPQDARRGRRRRPRRRRLREQRYVEHARRGPPDAPRSPPRRRPRSLGHRGGGALVRHAGRGALPRPGGHRKPRAGKVRRPHPRRDAASLLRRSVQRPRGRPRLLAVARARGHRHRRAAASSSRVESCVTSTCRRWSRGPRPPRSACSDPRAQGSTEVSSIRMSVRRRDGAPSQGHARDRDS